MPELDARRLRGVEDHLQVIRRAGIGRRADVAPPRVPEAPSDPRRRAAPPRRPRARRFRRSSRPASGDSRNSSARCHPARCPRHAGTAPSATSRGSPRRARRSDRGFGTHGRGSDTGKPPKGGVLRLPRDQFGLPQNRQAQPASSSDAAAAIPFDASCAFSRTNWSAAARSSLLRVSSGVEILVVPVQHQLSHRLRRR
jgi:hypothetical protein